MQAFSKQILELFSSRRISATYKNAEDFNLGVDEINMGA
jgi:hypothetical protein